MRVRLLSACAAVLLVMAAAPAAAMPTGGCPAPASGFGTPMTFDDYWAARTVEADPGASWRARAAAAWSVADRNGDGLVCAKALPDTPGIPAVVEQFKDNTAA
jgi:hypothetical protein